MSETAAENRRIYGTAIPKAEAKQEREDLLAKGKIYAEAITSGMSEGEAQRAVEKSGIGSITPNLDRAAAFQNSTSTGGSDALGEFKTYGDKATFEARNALRKLKGLEPIPEPLPADKQFVVDLEKSASFGEGSALTGAKGQARAFEAGVRAGYSPEETRKMISDTAARITGVADQQQQPTETPKSPAKLPFFEQVYEQFRAPASTTTTPAAAQTTATPKSPAQPPLFERAYEQFKIPTPLSPATPPPPATPPVNPQNMTTTDGIVAAGMRGSLGGIPTQVVRDATSEAKNLLAPLAQTVGFFKAADQLDYILGRKRNQK